MHNQPGRVLGLCCSVATALLLALPRADATTVAPMSIQTLTDHAACVMTGEVVEVTSFWTVIDGRRTIESRVELANAEVLKGPALEPAGTFTLTVPGGVVDGYQLRVAGAPEFALGQRWVLFILPAWRTHPVVGVYRGAFEVIDGRDGVSRVYQQGHGVSGLDDAGRIALDAAGPVPPGIGDDDLAGRSLKPTEIRPVVTPSTMHAALTEAEFLAIVDRAVRRSRPSASVGRRRTGPYTPVPLERPGPGR